MDQTALNAAVEQALATAFRAYASGQFADQELRMREIGLTAAVEQAIVTTFRAYASDQFAEAETRMKTLGNRVDEAAASIGAALGAHIEQDAIIAREVDVRMSALEHKIDDSRAATARVETSTEGIVTMMNDWDGAMKLIERIAKVLKPLTYIVTFCGAVVALWYGIRK